MVFREDAGVAGDPDDQLVGADAAVADGDFSLLGGCRVGQRQQEK
jgi:hypothetical protein